MVGLRFELRQSDFRASILNRSALWLTMGINDNSSHIYYYYSYCHNQPLTICQTP